MNEQTPFMIVTSDLASDSETLNARKRKIFERQLLAAFLRHRKVEGAYQGVKEIAYLVHVPTVETEQRVLQLAWRYQQKTVLRVANNNLASLYHITDDDTPGTNWIKRVEHIGFWREIDPQAEGHTLPESYTLVRYGDRETYFTTKAMP